MKSNSSNPKPYTISPENLNKILNEMSQSFSCTQSTSRIQSHPENESKTTLSDCSKKNIIDNRTRYPNGSKVIRIPYELVHDFERALNSIFPKGEPINNSKLMELHNILADMFPDDSL